VSPHLALAGDVLVRAARTRVLWVYLILGSLVAAAIPAGIEFTEVAPDRWQLRFFVLDLPPRGGDGARAACVLELAYMLLYRIGGVSLFGVGLGVLATQNAVASAFAPGTAELILPRPISRAGVALSRFAGALAFGLIQAGWASVVLFLGAGAVHGVWRYELLVLGPCVVFKLALVLALATLAVVATRSRVLGILAGGGLWLSSFAVDQVLDGVRGGEEGVLTQLAPHVTWAQRLLPRISGQDLLAEQLIYGQVEAPVASLLGTLAQGGAWTALALAATVLLLQRRDP
jgi:hypothetical protein